MDLDRTLLEQERIRTKLALLTHLGNISPFRHLPGSAEDRILRAIQGIPVEHSGAALLLFASTIYLTSRMLDDAWRSAWRRYSLSFEIGTSPDDTLFLEVDKDSQVNDLYRSNSFEGRIGGVEGIDRVADVERHVLGLLGKDASPSRAALQKAFGFSRWVLISDISLSGGSLLHQLRRLSKCLEIIDQRPERLTILVQLVSETALKKLSRECECLYGIRIPACCSLVSSEFSLASESSVASMRRACHWFGEEMVAPNSRLAQLAEKNPAASAFGHGAEGWMVVTHRNAPDNSPPILWHPPRDGSYDAPFIRLASRKAWGENPAAERLENLSPMETNRIRRRARMDP